jgi:hypothetical protein
MIKRKILREWSPRAVRLKLGRRKFDPIYNFLVLNAVVKIYKAVLGRAVIRSLDSVRKSEAIPGTVTAISTWTEPSASPSDRTGWASTTPQVRHCRQQNTEPTCCENDARSPPPTALTVLLI